MHKRRIWDNLREELDSDEVIVITGPRQVGKTTTINWLLDQISGTNKIYFDLEKIADRDFFDERDYDSIVNKLQLRGINTDKRTYIAIDEIQYLPNLPSVVKYLYDHYKFKFFLTGSSSYYIKNLFSQSMAGRKILYEMFPLNFVEFLTFQGVNYQLPKFTQELKFSQDAYSVLKTYYEEYIEYGGLPAIALAESKKRKLELLNQIYSSYINLDVQTLADFRQSKNITKLVNLLVPRIGNKLNVSDLAGILGVSRITVENYLLFLEQTYLIRRIGVHTNSPDVVTRKQEKLYFVDTGIANINGDLSAGAKFENAVAHQLQFYGKLEYFDVRNREVDFILGKKGAFEVKETPLKKHVTQMHKKLQNKRGIKHIAIIGRNKPVGFSDFIWGGQIA